MSKVDSSILSNRCIIANGLIQPWVSSHQRSLSRSGHLPGIINYPVGELKPKPSKPKGAVHLIKETYNNIDVLLTYGWNRVAYNILRSLSSKGIKVCVGDTSRLSMSFWSKYSDKSFLYPSFYSHPQSFINCLKSNFSKYRPKVYIPTHEETFIVAKYIEELKPFGVEIPISDLDTLKTLQLKHKIIELAKRLKISTPNTIQPADLSDVKAFSREVGYPVVIKMLNSNSAKGVFYAHSENQLINLYEKLISQLSREQFPILQEYVIGSGYGVSLLFNKGEPKAIFTHRRIREKISTGGTSTKRISTRNSKLECEAVRLLSEVKYHGVAMVEFKYNEDLKKEWLLEVNPRFWGSLALPIIAGIDFPFLLYKMAIEGDLKFTSDYKEGVVVRWVLGDILATLSEIKHTRSLQKPIKEFFTFDESGFDDFCLDDPLPFIAEMIYYFSKFLKTRSTNPIKESILEVDKL